MAPHVPTCTPLSPHHGEGGSWLSVRPSHPACHRDTAARRTTHPSDVMLHHCSNIPSQAAATSSTAMTLHDIMQQGPHHTPKAPQSSDNMVTSQQPMTSCCTCPSNLIFPFLPFPGCHSCTCQGRRQAGDISQPLSHSSWAAPGCQQCPLHGTSAPKSPAPAAPLLRSKLMSPGPTAPAAPCCQALGTAPSHTPLTAPGLCVHPTTDASDGHEAPGCWLSRPSPLPRRTPQRRTWHAGTQPAAANAVWR